MSESPYQIIKRTIAECIASGEYTTGQALPSEHDLCRRFGVARMTVNRAMRELAAEQLVRRVPGVGSFVAEPTPQSDLIEIRNIADEILSRGHHHSAQIFCLEATLAPRAAVAFGLPPSAPVFRSAILHCENALPIQFEDRLVNPEVAPDYLAQDFTTLTPNAYLMRVAPLQNVEHVVQAIAAPAEISAHLKIDEGAACLLVSRRTWALARLASITRLYHTARYRLGGTFEYKGAIFG